MKFKYTDILVVENIVTSDVDVVEAPSYTVPVGSVVTYGDGNIGKVISRHWVGDETGEESVYALVKAIANPLYTLTGYAAMKEVTPDEDT